MPSAPDVLLLFILKATCLISSFVTRFVKVAFSSAAGPSLTQGIMVKCLRSKIKKVQIFFVVVRFGNKKIRTKKLIIKKRLRTKGPKKVNLLN